MRKYNIPIFIPHIGCPHDCVFCNQKKITGADTNISPEIAKEKISEYIENIDCDNAEVEIAFFGGSFTGIDIELQKQFLEVANEFKSKIKGIRLSTRPDYISREILDMLKSYGVTSIELGVQSTDDTVLELNKRGHTFDDVKNAVKLIRENEFELGLQMMVGMFGSNAKKDIKTAKDLISLHPDTTRIYPTITIKGTALEKYYLGGRYVPYTVMQAAEIVKEIYTEFKKNNITILRIGLHSTEDMNDSDTVIAGPYHPAFGEIVESMVYRDLIENKYLDCANKQSFVYNCPKSDISKCIGHNGMNKKYFKDKYDIKLKVKGV